jgi:hypothetical protein
MNFENTGREQVIYRSVWGGKDFPNMEIEKKAHLDGAAQSYKIKGEPEKACEIIKDFYKIDNPDLFDPKFEQAVSGNGDERKKILTLHSSSRLALLTFYNIDDDNQILTLNIDGKDIDFNFSAFEFKNPVIGYPSNMDVVLVSADGKTVLFLESKFSEYYMNAGVYGTPISVQYETNKYSKDFYEENWLKSIGIGKKYIRNKKTGKEEIQLSTTDETLNYLDGFKQMISHYIGIRRRIKEPDKRIAFDLEPKNKETADRILEAVGNPETKVYLGEILYDKFYRPEDCKDQPDPQTVLGNYSKLYSRLADKMNEIIKEDGLADKFVVLKDDITYSKVMKHHKNLEPITRYFYE